MSTVMTILTPDTDHSGCLRQIADPVTLFDSNFLQLTADLHASLTEVRQRLDFGRAMAAPQVGVSLRIVVINLGADPITLVNPEIIWRSEEHQEVWDDCLSTPETRVKVRRHSSISITFQNEVGEIQCWHHLPADISELLQHELEHLDGILMVDYANENNTVLAHESHLLSQNLTSHRLSLNNIKQSRGRIDPLFLNGSLRESKVLGNMFGTKLYLKDETDNPLRCFKGRGAENYLSLLEQKNEVTPLVCASAGNWGMALAWSCRERSYPLTVFVATNASQVKVEKIKELGANVIVFGDDFDSAKSRAKAYSQARGYQFVEDGQIGAVSEGAGSVGVELTSSGIFFDAIYIPVGNGALITGVARWIKASSPGTKIVGIVPKGADSMYCSWKSSSPINREKVNTIADGLAIRVPVPESVEDMIGLVDDIILVDEEQIESAVKLAEFEERMLLEPSGAAGIAGVMAAHQQGKLDDRIAVIITGANRA
ncbi:pyridoxal-phosphate dependent enzyme [Vibrio sp. RC27]